MLWRLEGGRATPRQPGQRGARAQPRLAQDMNTRKAPRLAPWGLFASLRASRAPAIAAACWSPAGRLLVTTRPVREALAGMRAAPVYPGCGRKSATDLQRGFSARYFLRTAALERSASDWHGMPGLAARNALIRSTACRKNALAQLPPQRLEEQRRLQALGLHLPPLCRPAPDSPAPADAPSIARAPAPGRRAPDRTDRRKRSPAARRIPHTP